MTILRQPLNPQAIHTCPVHALSQTEKHRTVHGPMTAQYEDMSFTIARTAKKLVK